MNASFERTKSLWMSQTKIAEGAPRLSEDLTCDVVIVGAGKGRPLWLKKFARGGKN
jgi:hypothetical protein